VYAKKKEKQHAYAKIIFRTHELIKIITLTFHR
jgi:hypothetical protein